MNFDFQALLDALKNAKPRTKLVALLALVLVVAVVSVASLYANRPNFVLLYSGLDDGARATVEKALATGSIRYRVSQPPGPYVLYVDEGQYYDAQNLVALAGSLKEMPRGVDPLTDGASSLFLSSAERAQSMQKRDWQEMERQLEALDFVGHATVTSSTPESSPLRDKRPPTVSVLLALESSAELSREQAENVAKLVRFRFGVPAENLVISDQSGRTLFDPTKASGAGNDPGSLLEYSHSYDRELEAKINQQLGLAYGERKALATVTTEWDHDQRTTIAETVSPKGTLVSERKTKSETPQGSAPANGGPAGTASNIAGDSGFGVDNAAPGSTPETPESGALAVTSEEQKTWETGRSKTQTIHATPVLKRLSVSLLLDESLAAKKSEISSLVQAAVGFSTERNDVIQVGTTAFAAAPESKDEAEPESAGGMSPLVEMLIKRALEIVAAIAFMFVLFKTLKGSRAAARSESGSSGANGVVSSAQASGGSGGPSMNEAEPDPEMLARARVDELVKTDPRRVGEILSRWASEGRQAARAGK